MHLTRGARRGPMALVPLLALAACGGEKRSATADSAGAGAAATATTPADSAGAAAGGAPTAYAHAATITGGFKTPESVKYDADLDVYFVSNITAIRRRRTATASSAASAPTTTPSRSCASSRVARTASC